MSKRRREGPVVACPPVKRAAVHDYVHVQRGVKRPSAFDEEVAQAHKRLRATVPTAEEAIAFILPHMIQLRQTLEKEQAARQTLVKSLAAASARVRDTESKNEQLMQSLTAAIAQRDLYHRMTDQLRRALEMAQYRLVLADKEKFSHTA